MVHENLFKRLRLFRGTKLVSIKGIDNLVLRALSEKKVEGFFKSVWEFQACSLGVLWGRLSVYKTLRPPRQAAIS